MTINLRSNTRKWNLLCWNVKGINSSSKWNSIKSIIKEKNCDMICLQETKREQFDQNYIKKFCTPDFDKFEFIPSVGASGGTIVCRKSSRFIRSVAFQNSFAMSLEFCSVLSGASWYLTNLYAPCTPEGKQDFLDWLVVGNFNLIRRPEDRNKPCGNVQDMLNFNAAISALGLEELKLNGNKFTWTNKQSSPLLERLDWFFASVAWLTTYPSSYVSILPREVSDHSPCLISINTNIP
jgi:exonuclease III